MPEELPYPTEQYCTILGWLQDCEASGEPGEEAGILAAPTLLNDRKRLRDPKGLDWLPRKRQALSPPNTEPEASQRLDKLWPPSHSAMDGHNRDSDDVAEDAADITPRAPSKYHSVQMAPPSRPSPSRTPSSRSSSKRSASSSLSRNSSPTKQLRAAELDDEGYHRRAFTREREALPGGLRNVLRRLRDIGNGGTQLPHAWWEEGLEELEIPRAYFCSEEEGVDAPSHARPDVSLAAFVKRVTARAVECDMQGEPECVWSLEVYYRILLWVLRPVNDTAGLVDLRPSTSSRINPHFHRLALPSKMIDCCLVFKPEPGSRVDRRIEQLSKTRPGNSINHTDSGSLCRHPIGLSVEVKSREGDALEAEVQMGTWHAAQWRSMRRHAPDGAAIEFLPGIIISGHEWYFVATLPPEHSPDPFTGGTSKPTLYSRMHLGSTSDEQGVCKIVASLRCLVDWLEREYWPAFQEEVLGLPPG